MSSNNKESSNNIIRAVGKVSIITLLSRIFGYIRDRLIAFYLGTAFGADAFYLIFAIPNTFRRLVGEGAMSAAFIPVFTDSLENKGEKESWRLANRAFYLLTIVLLVLTLLGVVFSAQILSFTDFKAKYGAEDFNLAVKLNMIIFPYVLFICLSALLMGVLNSKDSFVVPAFTPVLLNLTIITTGLFFASKAVEPTIPLAWGILVGGVIQLLFQIPFAVKKGMTFRPSLSLTDPSIVKMGKLLLPAMFGAGIYQINVLVVRFVASYLYEGSISSLYYASRIMEFTLGIYALSVATVILPKMSRQGARGDHKELATTLTFGLRIVSYICIPASAGMIVLSKPVVDVLFKGGKYSEHSAILTSNALTAYSVGLLAVAGVGILVRAFYALKDTKTPVIVATISFLTNLLFIAVLIKPMGHTGLALASTIAAFVNVFCLGFIFMRKKAPFNVKSLIFSILRIMTATAVMSIVVGLFSYFTNLNNMESLKIKATLLFFAIAVGAVSFGISSALVKCPELGELTGIIKRKK